MSLPRLGANAGRRVCRKVEALKCPRCRCRQVTYFRSESVIRCACQREFDLADLPESLAREFTGR